MNTLHPRIALELTGIEQADDSEDEMIASRILFYTTYDTTMDFEILIKSHALADNVAYVRQKPALLLANVLTSAAIEPPCETIP